MKNGFFLIKKWPLLAPMLLLGACSLDDAGKEGFLSDDPVFVLQGLNDGQAYQYSAGEDSIYMFTNYRLNAGGGHEFTGRFAAERCAGTDSCPGQMAFTFRGSSPLSLFLQKNYPFLNETSDSIIAITCYALDTVGSNVQLHTSRSSATAPRPLLLNTAEDNVMITAEKTDKATGTKSILRIQVAPERADSCMLPVIHASVANNIVELQADPFFTDANFSWGAGNSVQFPYQFGQQYAVTITTATPGCTSEITFQNLPSNTPGIVYSSPKLALSATPQSAALQTGVSVQFINDLGQIFAAPVDIQDSLSYFNVHQIEEYLNNENGLPTIRFYIDFRCKIAQQETIFTAPLRVLTGKGVIAVGVP